MITPSRDGHAGQYARGVNTKGASLNRAQQLLEIPPRGVPEVFPGMELTAEQVAALEIKERWAPGPNGAPDVRLLVYRPKHVDDELPVILSMHGGAFCMYNADSFAAIDASWSLDLSCVVVSVDYRLAPEHPFPAGPEDCYAALLWTVAHADELGVDTDRLVVAGASAGGALAAAVTLMARDRNGPPIAFQALMIPVLDDRMETPSMRQAVEAPGFNSPRAEGMWLHYLGEQQDRSATSPYAAPARATDLSNLPPACIQTNGLDPLRDEGIQYGLRLLAEGIPVELHNVPGAYHGAPPLNLAAAARGAQTLRIAMSEALWPGGPGGPGRPDGRGPGEPSTG